MPGESTQDIILAIVLVFAIATACQIIAPRLRIPSLVLLLPAGFMLGLWGSQFRLDLILGPVFPIAVDFIVAIILFQGGLGLSSIPLQGAERSVVRRLIWIGAPLTGLLAALAAHFIIGMDWPMAFMLGAILIVSGPTVVNPILDVARPTSKVRKVLLWEGTLLDPLGALTAVLVFQLVKVTDAASFPDAVGMFFVSIGVAVLAALFGSLLFVLGGYIAKTSATLATQVVLGSVIVTAGLANALSQDSGLLAALLMGMTAPRIAKRFGVSIDNGWPFFDTIVSIGIGVLFVSIAALVPLDAVMAVLVPTIIVAVLLIVLQRPLVTMMCTRGSGLTRNERVFIAMMDPRGIVAAATASSVGAILVSLRIPGANALLPAAFIIIAITVTVYGLSASTVARKLGIQVSETTNA